MMTDITVAHAEMRGGGRRPRAAHREARQRDQRCGRVHAVPQRRDRAPGKPRARGWTRCTRPHAAWPRSIAETGKRGTAPMQEHGMPVDGAREFVFTSADFERIQKLIHDHAGISLGEQARMVYSRLARRLRAHGLTRFGDYLAFLKSGRRGMAGVHQFAHHQPDVVLPRGASLSRCSPSTRSARGRGEGR